MVQRHQVNLVTGRGRVARLAAALAAIGFASLAVFQAALAAGAPWGMPPGVAKTRISRRASGSRAQSPSSST